MEDAGVETKKEPALLNPEPYEKAKDLFKKRYFEGLANDFRRSERFGIQMKEPPKVFEFK